MLKLDNAETNIRPKSGPLGEKDLRIAGVHLVKERIFVVSFLHVSFPPQMMLSVGLVKRKVMCFGECQREEGCDYVG